VPAPDATARAKVAAAAVTAAKRARHRGPPGGLGRVPARTGCAGDGAALARTGRPRPCRRT
jgi:hypothetical protein